MIEPREFVNLARETGAFKDIELEILRESLAAWQKRPGDPYRLLELRDGKVLAGFALMCREPNTEYSFDVRALCVGPDYIGTGAAGGVVALLEDEVLRLGDSGILRVETSSRKEKAIDAGLLAELGFTLIGHIPDFYEPGDDYYMYAKHLRRPGGGPAQGEGS